MLNTMTKIEKTKKKNDLRSATFFHRSIKHDETSGQNFLPKDFALINVFKKCSWFFAGLSLFKIRYKELLI